MLCLRGLLLFRFDSVGAIAFGAGADFDLSVGLLTELRTLGITALRLIDIPSY
jgi:hypothetical protein